MKRLLMLTVILIQLLSAMGQKTAGAYTEGKQSYDGTGKYYMGREIAHVMGAAGSDWLDRASRQKEENSSMAVKNMPVTEETVVADIGAGTGYYSFMLAKKAKRVIAVEIQDELIEMLNSRIKENGVKNMDVLKGSTKSSNLAPGSIDMALMVDVYHELSFPVEILKNIHEALRSGGKLVLLEYKAEDPSVAIKEHHKMSVAQAKKEMEANGFRLVKNGDFLPIQHFLIFEKQ